MSELRRRWVVAMAAAGAVAAVSYAVQRLSDPPGLPPGSVLASVHIPYHGRVYLALLHAVAAGSVAFGAARGARLGPAERAAPWVVVVAVALSAVGVVSRP